MVLAVHHIAQLKKCNLRNTADLFFAVYHSKSRRSFTESKVDTESLVLYLALYARAWVPLGIYINGSNV